MVDMCVVIKEVHYTGCKKRPCLMNFFDRAVCFAENQESELLWASCLLLFDLAKPCSTDSPKQLRYEANEQSISDISVNK